MTYRVRFRYDRNLKFADAFASEVESVTLCLFDEQGRIVWRKTEPGRGPSRPRAMPWRWTSCPGPTTWWPGAGPRTRIRSPFRTAGPQAGVDRHAQPRPCLRRGVRQRGPRPPLPRLSACAALRQGRGGRFHLHHAAHQGYQQRAGGFAAAFGRGDGQGPFHLPDHGRERPHGLGQRTAARRAGLLLRLVPAVGNGRASTCPTCPARSPR